VGSGTIGRIGRRYHERVVRINAFIVGGVLEVDYAAASEFLYVFIVSTEIIIAYGQFATPLGQVCVLAISYQLPMQKGTGE